MNDTLENLHLEADSLRFEKNEAQILSDYYTSTLKNITDNDAITSTLIRKEAVDRRLKEVTEELAKKAYEILNFNIK